MGRSVQATQAGMLVSGKLLATAAEALAPVFFVRLLPKLQVGILVEVLLIYTTVALILTAGLPLTLPYHLPARPAGERAALSRRVGVVLLALGVATSLLMLLVGMAAEAGLVGHSRTLRFLLPLCLFPIGDIPMFLLPQLLVVEKRTRAASGIGALRSAVMSLAILIPLALGASLWTVMAILSVCGIGLLAFTFHVLRGVYREAPACPSPLTHWELLRFGFPLGLTHIVANLNNRFDRFLILLCFSELAYAEYQAGSWQVPLIPGIAAAIGIAYGPHLAELFKAGRRREAVRVWREQSKKTALLVIPISAVFAIAAEETIELLFTADYLRGAPVFRCYAIMTLGRITAFGAVLVSAGRPDFVIKAATLTFGANVVLSVPLVLLLGFLGPALGTLLAFPPMVYAYCWYMARATGLRVADTFPLWGFCRVLLVGLLAAAPAILVKLYLPLTAGVKLALVAVSLIATFAIAGTLLGLIEDDDWRFLLAWLRLDGFRGGRGLPDPPSAHPND